MKKILVIDDESIIRISCQRSLSNEGYEVKLASSGKEGIELLEKGEFNLVLLDIKMPDMDGIEVLKKITSTWPETKVIMITGYSTVEAAVKTLRLGALNYLEKPFTPDSLIETIKEALS
ncbi:MAG: sigma-54-dependent Fis family transcriptional regulator [Thermodesulfovibrionia bacterium]|nr:sigma-54-dependent Fis family transcriptional regulator [Thermodesulfovibrionia bacterium]